jgi:hypothetical protein
MNFWKLFIAVFVDLYGNWGTYGKFTGISCVVRGQEVNKL